MSKALGLISSSLRPGHPSFLDLPWERPLGEWVDHCDRIERLPVGESRHPVVFVNYDGVVYALKAVSVGKGRHEYNLLVEMKAKKLPIVEAVGYVRQNTPEGEFGVLVTRYLDHSLPYAALFIQNDLARYRDHLLDALAGLLVQLHLAGVFWGDCSLNNTLFLRDAGTLQAYMVDAETSEVRETISDAMREYELEIMHENVAGGLADLIAMGALSEDFPFFEVAEEIAERYRQLWAEINREELVSASDRYSIQERVRALNQLGFSVGEIELSPADTTNIRMKVMVTDRNFHRELLASLTGIDAQEHQAQLMLNEIQQIRATLSEQRSHSMSLSAAAYAWKDERYDPVTKRADKFDAELGGPEAYCQVLEHKWLLSERAQQDVGFEAAVEDMIERGAVAPEPDPSARTEVEERQLTEDTEAVEDLGDPDAKERD